MHRKLTKGHGKDTNIFSFSFDNTKISQFQSKLNLKKLKVLRFDPTAFADLWHVNRITVILGNYYRKCKLVLFQITFCSLDVEFDELDFDSRETKSWFLICIIIPFKLVSKYIIIMKFWFYWFGSRLNKILVFPSLNSILVSVTTQ